MWKESVYKFSSFDSMKVLAWQDNLRNMYEWSEGKDVKLMAPVSVTVDPTNICNVNCHWCIWKDFRKENPITMPKNQLLEMPKFLKEWGVKSVCVAGGGEPLLHPNIVDFFHALQENDLQVGLITNGIKLDDPEIREVVRDVCRWVGISVDAATSQTFQRVKKTLVGDFKKVIDNIAWLGKNKLPSGQPQIGLKFLIHHLNYGEMFQFADTAKTLGADDVHFRPVYLPGYNFSPGVRKTAEFHLREARKVLEDDNFHIYGILHKFERDWVRAIRFEKCRATPIAGFFAADGVFYNCCDRRGDKDLNLGKFYPYDKFLEKWGSKEHFEKVKHISPRACPRCTQTITNEIIEKVIIKDEMTINFV